MVFVDCCTAFQVHSFAFIKPGESWLVKGDYPAADLFSDTAPFCPASKLLLGIVHYEIECGPTSVKFI